MSAPADYRIAVLPGDDIGTETTEPCLDVPSRGGANCMGLDVCVLA